MTRVLIVYRDNATIETVKQALYSIFGENSKLLTADVDTASNLIFSAKPFDLMVLHDGVEPSLIEDMLRDERVSYIPYIIHTAKEWEEEQWKDLIKERVADITKWNPDHFTMYSKQLH